MAEARDVSVNREFIVSGFLSGQAYRLAVRVDSAAGRLIRLGLRDFDKARSLEQEIFGALSELEATAKTARKMIDKVNRRRREGVPTGGPKQTFMVRSLPSAHAFRCAVAVDQIQRDISMLGLASSGDVAKVASDAQSSLIEAINVADSIVQSVMKKTDSRRQVKRPAKPKSSPESKPQAAKAQAAKASSNEPDNKDSKGHDGSVTQKAEKNTAAKGKKAPQKVTSKSSAGNVKAEVNADKAATSA